MTKLRERIEVARCNECTRPCLAVLPRRHDDTDILRAERALRDDWAEWCLEVWETDVGEGQCVIPSTPTPWMLGVVLVTNADWEWLGELGFEDVPVGWSEADTFEGPDWWLNRRRRIALRWDCCNLDDPRP